MIRFIDTAFVHGNLYRAGMLGDFDLVTEVQLIKDGDAVVAPFPKLVDQLYKGWSRTSNNLDDTVPKNLVSIVMPGGLMRPNSKLIVIPDWDIPGSATTKYLTLYFGGSTINAPSVTTQTLGKLYLEVQNLDSQSSQSTSGAVVPGVSTGSRTASSIDTSQDVTIAIGTKWGANVSGSAETIKLVGYSIWHYPGSD